MPQEEIDGVPIWYEEQGPRRTAARRAARRRHDLPRQLRRRAPLAGRRTPGHRRRALRSITAPTFLVIGDHDFVRLDHAAEMLDLFPDCRLAVLPGTRHTEVMQRSEQLRTLAGPFLA